MWTYNSDFERWSSTVDSLSKTDFDFLKQELAATRYFSKNLSGSTFIPINNLDDIYDILGEWMPKNWYVSTIDSQYVDTDSPSKFFKGIDKTNSYDYYTKFLAEYGMTLKNLFTADRLIKDSVKNYIQVDVATTTPLNIYQSYINLTIDGVLIKPQNRVLVKDQIVYESLSSDIDPENYFTGKYKVIRNLGGFVDYQYFGSENGIYVYDGRFLIKQADYDDYEKCVRSSVYVNMGTQNAGKQFHLARLLSGYYPTSLKSEPMEFKEAHNWLLRNRVDYNNLFEINYFDVKKYATHSYNLEGVTYSIPERTVSVGEFGIILNTQNGVSNIIENKYIVNLRGISETSMHYWICGDENTLLKVRKHDFLIERIKLDSLANLTSVSFFNDLRGSVVGEQNTILLTLDSGATWRKLRINEFSAFSYSKVLFAEMNRLYVVGKNGVFVEVYEDVNGWTAYRRRISKQIDDEDEYLLVENINDLYKTKTSTWGLSYSYSGDAIASQKELLFISTDGGNVIAYDIGGATRFDFLYFDFGKDYGDIRNISKRAGTDKLYFTGNDGLYYFDLNDFKKIGVGNSYSNTVSGTYSTLVSSLYANEIFDYNGNQILICGNNSLLRKSDYNTSFDLLDSTFETRLKPKLLFMDYDMGAKLNFFTDQGEYRLPGSVTFSAPSTGFTFSMRPLVHGATAPSYATQSETNWWTRFSDDQKTFQFYSQYPMTDGSSVLMSPTFSYYSKYQLIKPVLISNAISDMQKLAPGIALDGFGRFSATSSAITYPAVTAESKLYLYDYLAILEANAASFSAQVGDVIRLESVLVDANFVVNRIGATSSGSISKRFYYMYSEFNQNIITDLIEQFTSDPSSVSLKNLNRFKTGDEFVANLNSHPIGTAYSASNASSNVVKIDPRFNASTAYYNLATNVVVNNNYYTMSYTDGFLNFKYTPTYNLLDYLEGINSKINLDNPLFYESKEYFAMPVYRNIPIGTLTASNVYIDQNGLSASNSRGNKMLFGPDIKLEWESIFINTFVDVTINQPVHGTQPTTKLLVMAKREIKNYDNLGFDAYEIEFERELNFVRSASLAGGTIDIVSRRTLGQISADLQELNNIQGSNLVTKKFGDTKIFNNYGKSLNFKFPTDSYAKVLMSDVDTVNELSAIMYVDYKNELAMNITRLGTEYNIPILNTANYGGKLYIQCLEKHLLSKNDGVVLDFTGGTYSSQSLNRHYFGYRVATTVINEYDFVVDVEYGQDIFVGNDVGFVRYVKRDPFLNYQPIDIIDVGIDKKGKKSIELSIENLEQTDGKFSLVNVDFEKYRLRLVDSLNMEIISLQYPWLLEAEVSGAVVGMNENAELIWYKGIWESGRWFGGNWISGTWKSGDWYGGVWDSKSVTDKVISMEINNSSSDSSQSTWVTGRWYDGTWKNGTWTGGRWYGGVWESGDWYNGTWNDGEWMNGRFIGGIWVSGIWSGGVFNTDNGPAFWIDGEWNGGDFENGMWYNGVFSEKKGLSTFGLAAFNSRTATWHGGKWNGGSFYSGLTGSSDVSEANKYSIWYTGQWMSGDFHGGVAYNMTFNTGIWHGGILEEVQIVGINDNNKSFILNGVFKFNIGDEIYVLDNNIDSEFSFFGSNTDPIKYTILKIVEDNVNKLTEIYVDYNFSVSGLSNYTKYSGLLNSTIPDNSYVVSTQSVSYTMVGTTDIKVKLNLTCSHIGDLTINLKAPNGNIINLKEYGAGGTMSIPGSGTAPYTKNTNNYFTDTVFSTTQSAVSFTMSSSPYTDTYEMMKKTGQGAHSYVSNKTDLADLLNSDGTINGDWSLYIHDRFYSMSGVQCISTATASSNFNISISGTQYASLLRIGDGVEVVYIVYSPTAISSTFSSTIIGIRKDFTKTYLTLSKVNNTGSTIPWAGGNNASIKTLPKNGTLIDWEISFINEKQIGAQINQPIINGFETGLRVVSNFKNGNWKSGIWTNGIYDSGTFEGGIWYNGIFRADWG